MSTFGLCLCAIVVMLPVSGDVDDVQVGAAFALLGAVGLLLAFAQRVRAAWIPIVGILAFLAAVGLLRNASPNTGGYSPLVLLPVIWAATRGRRSELVTAMVAGAAVFAIPLVLVGAPRYPAAGWRTCALMLFVGWVVATRVALLVSRLRGSAEDSKAILATMSEGLVVVRDGAIVSVNHALCDITGFPARALVGTAPPYAFWPPERLERLELERRQEAIERGDEIEVTLVRADGSTFPASVTETSTSDGVVITTVRDITVRRAHEEAILRRADGLAALAEVTRVVGHADPRDARTTICQVAQAVADATTVAIWERDADGTLRATCLLGAPTPDFTLPADDREHGAVMAARVGQALFVADAADSERVGDPLRRLLGCASMHFQPIESPAGTRGVLAVSWSSPRTELESDVVLLLEVLASEAATVLQRGDLLERLEELSRTDELTGLPNRRAWDELLAREMATARRSQRPLSVAILDLDHFKSYNDRRGHLAGDRLLVSAAAIWRGQLRETDVVARWGGEEFAVLLPGCDLASAGRLVDRLRDGRLPEGVTFSAGVTEWDGQADGDAFVAVADTALYQAKAGGRDRVALSPAA